MTIQKYYEKDSVGKREGEEVYGEVLVNLYVINQGIKRYHLPLMDKK